MRPLATCLLFLGLLVPAFSARAALYAPGETLDPACPPTDPGCGIQAQVGTGTAGQIPYYAANGGVLTATSSITILSNGNIGVGTTSPAALFSISIASSTPALLIGVSGSSTPSLYVGSANANGYIGINTASPLAPLQVGNGTLNRSSDSQVLISRLVDDSISGNGHAFSDSSNVSRSGTIGYNSYDARISISGTANYDHYAAFQAAPSYGSSGTMTDYFGLWTSPTLNTGTVTNVQGLRVVDPAGAGTVTNNYGIYIDSLSRGATKNIGLYFNNNPSRGSITSSSGTTISLMPGDTLSGQAEGKVGIGTTTPQKGLEVFRIGSPGEIIRVAQSGGAQNAGLGIDGAGSLYGVALFQGGTSRFVVESNGGIMVGSTYIASNNAITNGAIIEGSVGVGTTSPWRKLGVTGTVGFDGLTAAVGAGSLCLSANKEVVYNSGTDNCLSSTRASKHDIKPLNLSSLEMVQNLEPVSFLYNDDPEERKRYGFIAEDAADVDEHLATRNAEGKISGLDTSGFIALIVGAIQDMAESFTTKVLNANKICLEDVCITKNELQNLLEESNQQSLPTPEEPTPPTDEEDIEEPPVAEPVVEEPVPEIDEELAEKPEEEMEENPSEISAPVE